MHPAIGSPSAVITRPDNVASFSSAVIWDTNAKLSTMNTVSNIKVCCTETKTRHSEYPLIACRTDFSAAGVISNVPFRELRA